MNTILIAFSLLIVLAAVIDSDKATDGCVCLSASFGCENIKGPKKMVQTGWCNKRCCTENEPGEKRTCKCMNVMECPEDAPLEQGECIKMVECCPKMKKYDL